MCAEAKVAAYHALFADVVGKHGRPKTVYYICAGGGAGIKEMQQVWCILLQNIFLYVVSANEWNFHQYETAHAHSWETAACRKAMSASEPAR